MLLLKRECFVYQSGMYGKYAIFQLLQASKYKMDAYVYPE